jgi:hypothetical protein
VLLPSEPEPELDPSSEPLLPPSLPESVVTGPVMVVGVVGTLRVSSLPDPEWSPPPLTPSPDGLVVPSSLPLRSPPLVPEPPPLRPEPL